MNVFRRWRSFRNNDWKLFQFSFTFCINMSISWFFRHLIKTIESCLMINVCDVIKIIVRALFFISKLNKAWFLLKKFKIFFSIFVSSWYTRKRRTFVTTRSNIRYDAIEHSLRRDRTFWFIDLTKKTKTQWK